MTWVLRGILKAPRCVLTGVVGAFPRHPEAPFFSFIGINAVETIVWLLLGYGSCLPNGGKSRQAPSYRPVQRALLTGEYLDKIPVK